MAFDLGGGDEEGGGDDGGPSEYEEHYDALGPGESAVFRSPAFFDARGKASEWLVQSVALQTGRDSEEFEVRFVDLSEFRFTRMVFGLTGDDITNPLRPTGNPIHSLAVHSFAVDQTEYLTSPLPGMFFSGMMDPLPGMFFSGMMDSVHSLRAPLRKSFSVKIQNIDAERTIFFVRHVDARRGMVLMESMIMLVNVGISLRNAQGTFALRTWVGSLRRRAADGTPLDA